MILRKGSQIQERFLESLRDLEEIYVWDEASKARIIALTTSLTPAVMLVTYSLMYVFNLDGIAVRINDISQYIKLCIGIIVLFMFVAFAAHLAIPHQKYHRFVFSITLFTMSVCMAVLFTTIGVFDGLSWLLFFMYSSLGFVLMDQRFNYFVSISMFISMFMLSCAHMMVPYTVRAYRFTNDIDLASMSSLDFFGMWVSLVVACLIGIWTLGFLLGAWRNREDDLRSKSYVDELTSVMNRRAIIDGLSEEFYRAIRGEYPLSVAMLDLDFFKKVNDAHGHPFGDRVLVDAARHMIEITRKEDLIGRYGGEEFLIVFPECNLEEAKGILERLREILEEKPINTENEEEVVVTVSAGLAEMTATDKHSDALITRADKALYQAKEKGRNRVEVA